jgi:FMN phosphatase YigB (HAD superfamily)
MTKRIIFDLDNTLVIWKDKYLSALDATAKKYNVVHSGKAINDCINEYDDDMDHYDVEEMLKYINNHLGLNLDMGFMDEFLYLIGFCADRDEEVIETLEYLSSRYELVVLTNWFTKPQAERLKSAGIYKYFKEIIGGEKYMKPNKNAYINACGGLDPSECIMIGDSYEKDILPAYEAGLQVIFFNRVRKENPNKFKEIKSLIELKSML